MATCPKCNYSIKASEAVADLESELAGAYRQKNSAESELQRLKNLINAADLEEQLVPKIGVRLCQ